MAARDEMTHTWRSCRWAKGTMASRMAVVFPAPVPACIKSGSGWKGKYGVSESRGSASDRSSVMEMSEKLGLLAKV